ncbi:hypothetical protein [Haloarcula argentinensis]|uniref:Uncharacterized protein n=1 Tax=Haloarcula argentinensis TaxID=43776 RepID=A0ABU2F3L0_HALAR|nr:hypothetical protein [Haloarcula argentinensis]EMA20097.1 hypothetical protein C443_14732 [Haloarcula argentinensis DSM 12282]MDS0254620.1 hypothetical protein [Haloarcula argentinensis]
MDRTLSYGLVGCIGISASTIASAVVGDPFPVVVPAIVAAGVIGAHHVRERDTAAGADDQDVRASVEQVEIDGGREQ